MNKEDLVSEEITELLKNKGYHNFFSTALGEPMNKAALWDVQKWLREKFKLNIIIEDTGKTNRYYWIINDMFNQYKKNHLVESLEYNSYEEALQEAIYRALKTIKA